MLGIGHFIFGYSIILFAAHLFRMRNRWVYPLAYLGGLWALIPDLHQLSYIPSMVKDAVMLLHKSFLANLFFLHRYLDQVYRYDHPDDASIYLLIGLLITVIYSKYNPSEQS